MTRVTQRHHEVKRRTWCPSSPARPFPDWKVSSTRHLDPATRTSRRPATGVSQFTGGAVAADQWLVAAEAGFGQVDDGPVVEAVPLAAGPRRRLQPGPLRHLHGQGIRAELPRARGDFGRASNGEHVADLALFQRGPQLGVAAVDLIARDPAHTVPGVKEPADHAGGRLRLGREDGVLARSRRPAAGPGRTSTSAGRTARGRSPRVRGGLHGRGGQRPERFRSSRRCRCTGAVRALLHVPGLIDDQHRIVVVQMFQHVLAHVIAHGVAHGVASHSARPSRCCIPCGLACPARSAMLQQFLRGRSDSSPSSKSRTRRRGSTRANRPAIRDIRTSNASCQRAGSRLRLA
ncbi:hypothetical protein SAMN05421874_103351 [Nonomuraea maritima]|uniref:Uncharacterized protein n=1 Tax=Nonomuraea maritima TaxID=683260 RepID=A0A1G8X015_9ACTN|nr:hypothetical protein SAMN05421874_103351 [Nonomuraea maritima]